MSERVKMPALGESVTEGTVTRWLKDVGDSVEVDEPLLEVSTDKVDTEIPSPVAGTLQEILVQVDDTVPVGADLAVVGDGAGGRAAGGGEQTAGQSAGASGPDDAVGDPADGNAVAHAGDEGGQEPAEPQLADGDGSSEPQAPSDQPAGGAPMEAQDSAPEQPAPTEEPGAQPTDGSRAATGASGSETGSSGAGDGTTVTMPALGESVTEGTITRWLKAEGDEVAVDEPLLEVSTDKVDTEIPSPVAGTLTTILVQEDETVPVGADLAVVGGAGGLAVVGRSASGRGAVEESAPRSRSPPSRQPRRRRPCRGGLAAAGGTCRARAPRRAGDVRGPVSATARVRGVRGCRRRPAHRRGRPGTGPRRRSLHGRRRLDRRARPARTRTPRTAMPRHTSPRSCASWRPTTASTWPQLRARVSVAGSASRTSWTQRRRRRRPSLPRRHPRPARPPPSGRRAPHPPRRPPRPTAPSGARPRRCRASARRSPRRMVESLQVSAQLTTVVEVDVTRISRLRDRAKADFAQREGTKLSFLPFFALAAVEALKAHPTVNASIDGDDVTYHGDRAPRHGRGHREGPSRAGHQERRRPQHRRPGQGHRRRRRAHAEQQDHARRPRRWHLHRHEHRVRVGRCSTHRSSTSRRSPSSARERSSSVPSSSSRRTVARPSPSARWCTSPSPTTTGSSTARMPPASSPR